MPLLKKMAVVLALQAVVFFTLLWHFSRHPRHNIQSGMIPAAAQAAPAQPTHLR